MAEKNEEQKEGGISFESALEQLEAIVRQLEAGTMGLDEMVAAFEKGQKLIALCNGRLNEVEKRIELLVKTQAGGVETRPLQ